jgi:hypothetical protein
MPRKAPRRPPEGRRLGAGTVVPGLKTRPRRALAASWGHVAYAGGWANRFARSIASARSGSETAVT